ncbi:putative multidrug resistance ABC transporter ATP-binding/permease protein YheH [Geobacter sp. OR-1]|uniref:ABC transporter ATP-binding protein n=1 Tax=Geobacter sp. OR-1 TaxID=1266765 RepID=UPI000541F407|nr:ABC transporter ATP-binding protein [Geobacter sp. OR-1]GAM10283.1 putative multidrug resistance ABC transporter ATP-binding/permease protein YheH [Geobacter sp. OR-1]
MKNKTALRGTLKILLPYLSAYRGRLAVVGSLVIAVVLIDLVQPYLVKEAIDKYVTVPTPNTTAIIRMALAYFALILAGCAMTYYQEIMLQQVGLSIVRKIRIDLFNHIQRLALRYFDQNSSGRIITNVVSDTEALNNFFTQFLANIVRGSFSLVLIMFFMLRLNVTIALYCFLLIPLVAGITVIFQKRLRKVNAEVRNRLGIAIGFLAENLRGMAIIQIFHQEAKQQQRYNERNKALMRATIIENRYILSFFNVTEILGDLGIATLLWFGGGAVIKGTVSFGVLYAFVGYIRRFFHPISTISQQMNALQSAIVAVERISVTLQETPDIKEAQGAAAPEVIGKIELAGASLAYRPGYPVLHDISLTIQPGQRIGFVGATGAGKSSIMNLVTRFYDVTEGAVIIDGVDVRQWPLEDLRRSVGIVQQDVTLFSGTITDNIRFFQPEISAERVREACRIIGAEPFILRQSKGYDTVLSERGSTLSAGERQLLSFARVLVFDPRILILDEATACLDSNTEEVLQEAIHRVSQGRTLLVIAHRLSTIQQMDLICVLEQGRIVERGTHGDLLRRQGNYWRLHQSGLMQLHEAA